MRELGTVGVLRRYPVKSMLGEEITEAVITTGGVAKDRTYALLDVETGRVASAKQPRLWRTLLQCRAAWDGDTVAITLPDGRTVTAADGDVDAVLTEVVGRKVQLSHTLPADAVVARPSPESVIEHGVEADVDYEMLELGQASSGGTFVDYAPVSLFTTATLGRLGTESVRYRPNVLVDSAGAEQAFAENDWGGRVIRIGSVRVRGLIPTPRCAIPTLAHGELPRRVEAVRSLLTDNRIDVPGFGLHPCAGIYLEVLDGGTIRPGDAVVLE